MYQRTLKLSQALQKKSHFLFGPRSTGKTWLIRHELPQAQIFNLLNTETFNRLVRNPHLIESEIHSDLVVIDEVQKLPALLDEVHRLIEEKNIRFLLTGSSARKLKGGGANLLAGRARSLALFPLTSREIVPFDLDRYCNSGGIPMIYDSDEPWIELKNYVELYLKEEIIAEATVRRIDHYARFIDVIGMRSGSELNYQKIAIESGVPPRTVDNFVEVLCDTLLAFELPAFRLTKRRKSVSKSKIYLFDVGVANYLSGRKNILPKSEAFGKAFEHFVIQEIRACMSYRQLDGELTYWRTVGGAYEVACIIGGEIAVEIKASDRFHESMLDGLKALKEERKMRRYILVSRDPTPRQIDGIEVMGYQAFLDTLWSEI